MKRCPNCAQEAVRTSDWVCQWCAFPLVSGSYKKIDKSFRELKEERMPQLRVLEEESIVIQEPEIELNAGVEAGIEVELQEDMGVGPEPELETELEIELSPEVSEPEPELLPEEVTPEPEPVTKPKARASRKLATRKKPTLKTKDKPETKTTSKSKATAEAKPKKPATKRKLSTRSKPAAEAETESTPAPEIETETDLPSAGMEITVDELLSAYEADMDAADARFSNQDIRITGIIDRVEVKDTFNIYFVNLISSQANRLLQGVRCVFDSESGPALSQLEPGQTVTIQGRYDGSMIDISLKECRLVG